MPNAPSGAVIRMDSTAMDRINLPQGSPRESGTEPIAAWTVAFGRQEITQNKRSLQLRFVR